VACGRRSPPSANWSAPSSEVSTLVGYPPTTGVRLAVAPGYPQATTVGAVALQPRLSSGSRPSWPASSGERVVWIGEGTQIGYLPEAARIALGHGWS